MSGRPLATGATDAVVTVIAAARHRYATMRAAARPDAAVRQRGGPLLHRHVRRVGSAQRVRLAREPHCERKASAASDATHCVEVGRSRSEGDEQPRLGEHDAISVRIVEDESPACKVATAIAIAL